mmetsp:Transcript_20879/g.83208  ORF Transcript_20879/g.83208 Transcript_20879/m.83208 type:complete len:518 (+) Transcript_20879:1233-2786(+)
MLWAPPINVCSRSRPGVLSSSSFHVILSVQPPPRARSCSKAISRRGSSQETLLLLRGDDTQRRGGCNPNRGGPGSCFHITSSRKGPDVVFDLAHGRARERAVEARRVGREDVREFGRPREPLVVVRPARRVLVRDDARRRVPDEQGPARPRRLVFFGGLLADDDVEVADRERRRSRAPLVRVRERGLDVAHAIQRGVPPKVDVPEDVDVRLESSDAVAQKPRTHRLRQRRQEQKPLLRHELDARHEVRKRHHVRFWAAVSSSPEGVVVVIGAELGDALLDALVQRVDVPRDRLVVVPERVGPPTAPVVRHDESRRRDAAPPLDRGLRVEGGVMPREERRDDASALRVADGADARAHALALGDASDGLELGERVRDLCASFGAVFSAAPPDDPGLVVPGAIEDLAVLGLEGAQRLAQGREVVADVTRDDERIVRSRRHRADPRHVRRIVDVDVRDREEPRWRQARLGVVTVTIPGRSSLVHRWEGGCRLGSSHRCPRRGGDQARGQGASQEDDGGGRE